MDKRTQRQIPRKPGKSGLIDDYRLLPAIPDEMIDPAGNIVYTAYKGVDLGSNILTGPYRGGTLSDAYSKAMLEKPSTEKLGPSFCTTSSGLTSLRVCGIEARS